MTVMTRVTCGIEKSVVCLKGIGIYSVFLNDKTSITTSCVFFSGYFENPDIYIHIYIIYTIHVLHPNTRWQVRVLDNFHCSDVENAGFSAAKRA